jgi:hypothetical protein
MNFAEQTIQDAIEDGNKFIVLEPREVFAPSVMYFEQTHKRLVYNLDILLACLSKAYGWDAIESLEWFDYNVFPLTHMEKGPLFYDEYEEKCLTIED